MPEPRDHPVRPTKRALDDLNLAFPPLEHQLHTLSHPVIARAQQVPAEVAAQGAERVVTIDDLVWFKVKTGAYRAAVHKLDPAERRPEITAGDAWWWIGAAGTRKADSKSEDFYAQLTAECQREGKGTGGVSSRHLLPGAQDVLRLQAELATQLTLGIKRIICTGVAKSIRDGKQWTATLTRYQISILVRARAEEAYVAITTDGFIDSDFIAVVLGAVPGISADDWLEEPGGALGIAPGYGQIAFSAIIPPEYQSKIVDQYGDNT